MRKDISQVVESTSLTDTIPMLLAYFKVTATANDSLFELAHDLQSVAEVSRGLSLAQPVTHSPGQSKVVLVVLHGSNIVSHVKIGITKLTGRKKGKFNVSFGKGSRKK